MVCDVVEGSEDVDKTCRVPVMTCFKIKLKTIRWIDHLNLHQWSGVSLKLCVVIGAVDNSFHFIHVSLPIYLCIYGRQHDSKYNDCEYCFILI